jgi:PPM family protein phosphatase
VTVLRSGAATDVGRVRSVNQDLLLQSDDLFAVADGMGGHVGGEVAAQVAVEVLGSAFRRDPSVQGLEAAFAEANRAVWRQSQRELDLHGMGTTLTALGLVAGGDGRDLVALANVGDSRAYLLSRGSLIQLTADHSLAEEKVRQGELSEAEAAVHPHRHILTRALGVAANVQIDLWELHLATGDRLLLCSDGLSNDIGAPEMAKLLTSVADPNVAAGELVRLANEHGGNDNITVVVVDVVVGEDRAADVEPALAISSPRSAVPASHLDPPSDESRTGAEETIAAAADGAGADGARLESPGPRNDPGNSVSGIPSGADARVAAASVAVAPPPDDPYTTGLYVIDVEPAAATRTEVEPERKEKRGERRRRLGIPRRVTFRVLLFVLLFAVVLGAAYGVIRWYATQNWFVTIKGNELVVYQGRPGGLLWFDPKLVDRTGVTTAQVLPVRIPALKGSVGEPSLSAAQHYVSNLTGEFHDQQVLNTPPTTIPPPPTTAPTVPPTTAPPGATPPTTAPVTP